jgi:cellobiose transport system substrate-binding protein
MNAARFRFTWTAGAALMAATIALSGCAGSTATATNAPSATAAPAVVTAAPTATHAPITLKVATFGNSDFLATLAKEFTAQNPWITVEVNRAATEADARTNMFTKLAAGSGLADVEMIEAGWYSQVLQYATKFYPVVPDAAGGSWVPFSEKALTASDGKLYGYSIGNGPTAICYRSDLLDKAGMPSDPASVASMVGTWDNYFAAGYRYAANGGKGWFDSAYMIFDSQIEQLPFAYETADGAIVADSPQVEKIFKDTLALSPKLSAKLEAFSTDWSAAMGTGGFATMVCPSWMLTIIKGNSKGVTTWNIANAFPNGGGNLGGSAFVVPQQSQHPAEAAALANFLTSPANQVRNFQAGAAFPSRLNAFDSADLKAVQNDFFNKAPVGTIFGDRSKAITATIFKGKNFINIDTAAYNAMTRVENGKQSIDDAWTQFVQEVQKLK